MDLDAIFSVSFMFLCLAIAAITEIARRIVDYVLDKPTIPASKNSKLWRDLILPIAPFVVGMVFTSLVNSYPYPDGWEGMGARVVIGLVAGSLSGLVYRVANSFLKNKLQQFRVDNGLPTKQPTDPGPLDEPLPSGYVPTQQ